MMSVWLARSKQRLREMDGYGGGRGRGGEDDDTENRAKQIRSGIGERGAEDGSINGQAS